MVTVWYSSRWSFCPLAIVGMTLDRRHHHYARASLESALFAKILIFSHADLVPTAVVVSIAARFVFLILCHQGETSILLECCLILFLVMLHCCSLAKVLKSVNRLFRAHLKADWLDLAWETLNCDYFRLLSLLNGAINSWRDLLSSVQRCFVLRILMFQKVLSARACLWALRILEKGSCARLDL